jgi:hypothetical protein
VVVALIVIASCVSRSAAVSSPSPIAGPTSVASPIVSPSPISSTIAILYQPIVNAGGFGEIHEATVDHGAVTDRTVLQTTSGELAASTAGYAVLSLPRPGVVPNVVVGPQPATLDLTTGALRTYDIGPGTTYCILKSPDPTKLLVCQWAETSPTSQTVEILDLTSVP